MPRWSEILQQVYEHLHDIVVECPECRDVEQCISSLPSSPPRDIYVIDKCCTCILHVVLDNYINIPRFYLTSPLHEVAVYILDDAVIELGEESGSIISKENAVELIELLRDMGFRTSDLENYLKS